MNVRMTWRLLLSMTVATFAIIGGCECDPPDDPDGGVAGGDGTVIEDGESSAYRINPVQSELLVILPLDENRPGCGFFHSHIVKAEGLSVSFELNLDDPGASTLSAQVSVAGLAPDDNALRERFDAEVGDYRMSDGERRQIKSSVVSFLEGSTHPTLTFAASGITGLSGTDQTMQVAATVRGTDSTFPLTFTATRSGDVITIEGRGNLSRPAHGLVEEGVGGGCYVDNWPMIMKLVFEPGESQIGDLDAGVIPPFVEQIFPYEGDCDDDVGYPEVAEILVRRCAGCHLDPPRAGASVPLVTYEHWRTNSKANPERPLYEVAGEFMRLPATDGLVMPPTSTSTAIPPDELALALSWIDKGAPDVKCTPDVLPVRAPTPANANNCGPINYVDNIKQMFDTNCLYCHDGTRTGVPAFGDFENVEAGFQAGLVTGTHPFFPELNLWEMSLYRIEDRTMPPEQESGGGIFFYDFTDPTFQTIFPFEEGLATYQAWIDDGYPMEACD